MCFWQILFFKIQVKHIVLIRDHKSRDKIACKIKWRINTGWILAYQYKKFVVVFFFFFFWSKHYTSWNKNMLFVCIIAFETFQLIKKWICVQSFLLWALSSPSLLCLRCLKLKPMLMCAVSVWTTASFNSFNNINNRKKNLTLFYCLIFIPFK